MKTVKISLNNWFCGEHYPDTPFFHSMLTNFANWKFTDTYCRENKICAYEGCIDMSDNIVMVAPKEWVIKNCPELLENEEYKNKFTYPDDASTDRFGWPFPDYPFSEYCSSEPYGNYCYNDDEECVEWDEYGEYEDEE